MTILALVSPANAVDRYSDTNRIDPTAPLRAGWRWLPVEDTDPAFDTATQIRTGPVVAVLADKVTRVWTVRNKTAQELADEQAALRDAAVAQIDQTEDIIRALALVIQDSDNLHAARINAIKAAIAGGATLAAVKTAVAAVQDVPVTAPAQLRAAVRAKLGS